MLIIYNGLSFACGQNNAITLFICNNDSAVVNIAGYTFPKKSFAELEEEIGSFKDVTNGGPYQQTNQYIEVYEQIGLNRLLIKHFIERINLNSGLSFMKMNTNNSNLASNLFVVKHREEWVVYEIIDKYDSDDWCGVNWQYEYYEKLNNHVTVNDRLISNVLYKGPLYFALMMYFSNTSKIGENSIRYTNIVNYACSE